MPTDTWSALLQWLETKGFDRSRCHVAIQEDKYAGGGRRLVATSDIKPGQALVALPKSCLLNASTISSSYPSDLVTQLTAIQLICLHLCLNRRADDRSITTGKESYGEYIDTLPQTFETVPLWDVHTSSDSVWRRMESKGLIPISALRKANDVERRFQKDWQASKVALEACNHAGRSLFTLQSFLWAWLCVNSRSIWFNLNMADHKDNITLAPIIDVSHHDPAIDVVLSVLQMANHVPRREERVGHNKNDLVLLAASEGDESALTAGDEVLFSYGAHHDSTLLAEYGFVLGLPTNVDNSLDISTYIEECFDQLDPVEAAVKRSYLEDASYWGEYHLTLGTDGQVEPTFRVTVALAVLHLRYRRNISSRNGTSKRLSSQCDIMFEPFFQLINGEINMPSDEICAKSSDTLREICLTIEQRSIEALQELQVMTAQIIEQNQAQMIQMVEQLWRNERSLAGCLPM